VRGKRPGSRPKTAKKDADPKAAKPGSREKKAFSLLAATSPGRRGGRNWSDSYLALTQGGRPNRLVRWLNAQSIPPMLPPYHAGACKSELLAMLAKGHNKVKLSREETDKLACWIDLLVPYCGDYTEAAAWNEGLRKKYDRYSAKRKRMEAEEARNIAALIAARAGRPVKDLPPVPRFRPLPSQYAGAPAGERPVAMRE